MNASESARTLAVTRAMAIADDPAAIASTRRRVPLWVWAAIGWVGLVTLSVLNVGGYGEVFAVPAALGMLWALIKVWSWEQTRKAEDKITWGEEIARAALGGRIISLAVILVRGPRRPGEQLR